MLKWMWRVFALLIMNGVFADAAFAIPRFAARNNANCSTCHVNPTGGGQRNTYGKQVFSKFQLPMNVGDPEKTTNLNTEFQVTPTTSLAVGGDMRWATVATFPRQVIDETGDDAVSFQLPATTSFFLMQTDIYATAQLTKDFLVYMDYGVASGNSELWALKRLGENNNGYIKVGQFLPVYGLKLPNHRTYIREEGLGFEPNLREAGIELGVTKGKANAYLSIVNGTGLRGGLNPDWKPALIGRADVNISPGPLMLTLGVSAWYEPGGKVTTENFQEKDERTLDLRTGPYVLANMGKLTYLGELDFRRTKDNADGSQSDSYAVYNEFAYAAKQGVDLQLFYEALDPEITLTPNVMHRVGAGFEVFPTGFSEIRVLYRHTFVPNADEAAKDTRTFYSAANNNMDEIIVFAHFFL